MADTPAHGETPATPRKRKPSAAAPASAGGTATKPRTAKAARPAKPARHISSKRTTNGGSAGGVRRGGTAKAAATKPIESGRGKKRIALGMAALAGVAAGVVALFGRTWRARNGARESSAAGIDRLGESDAVR